MFKDVGDLRMLMYLRMLIYLHIYTYIYTYNLEEPPPSGFLRSKRCPEGVLERLFTESGGTLGGSWILWWSFWGLWVDFGRPWGP